MKTLRKSLFSVVNSQSMIKYTIEKVRELNHVRDCIISVLSKCEFLSEHKSTKVLGVPDDVSLLIID